MSVIGASLLSALQPASLPNDKWEERFSDAERRLRDHLNPAELQKFGWTKPEFTGDISVRVRSRFHEKIQITGQDTDIYIFIYQVEIKNIGNDPINVRGRRWSIRGDRINEYTNPITESVKGESVGGLWPLIAPGKSHVYTSAVPLKSPHGRMIGYFRAINSNGKEFAINTPMFTLGAPGIDLIPANKIEAFDPSNSETNHLRSAIDAYKNKRGHIKTNNIPGLNAERKKILTYNMLPTFFNTRKRAERFSFPSLRKSIQEEIFSILDMYMNVSNYSDANPLVWIEIINETGLNIANDKKYTDVAARRRSLVIDTLVNFYGCTADVAEKIEKALPRFAALVAQGADLEHVLADHGHSRQPVETPPPALLLSGTAAQAAQDAHGLDEDFAFAATEHTNTTTASEQIGDPQREPVVTKDTVAIARMQAALAEYCKRDLSTATADDTSAVQHARNLTRTVERLRERGVLEIPPEATGPYSRANKLISDRKKLRQKVPHP